jgi:hypothetical protein
MINRVSGGGEKVGIRVDIRAKKGCWSRRRFTLLSDLASHEDEASRLFANCCCCTGAEIQVRVLQKRIMATHAIMQSLDARHRIEGGGGGGYDRERMRVFAPAASRSKVEILSRCLNTQHR